MRMGRPNKKLRSTSKQTTNPNPPKYSSPTLVVGQVSSNVIHSIYGPALTKLAVESVEEYADAVLRWDASLPEVLVKPSQLDDAEDIDVDADGTFEKGEEVEVDLDGSILPSHDNDDERQFVSKKIVWHQDALPYANMRCTWAAQARHASKTSTKGSSTDPSAGIQSALLSRSKDSATAL